MKRLYPLSLLLFLMLACSDAPEQPEAAMPETEAAIEEELTPANLAPEFVEVLEAHGGLPGWNNAQAVSFLIRDFPVGDGQTTLTDFHRVNLGSRDQVIEGDNYDIVTRNDSTWISPGTDAIALPARLYQGASFYLMGMPFVFADAGITVTYSGEAEYGDETMDEFQVQIPDEMGDGGNDYLLYADPETHQLQYAVFPVTYPAIADMNLQQMVDFQEWQTVDGLIVPSVLTLYSAPDEVTEGTPGTTIGFERVSFSPSAFESSIFNVPDDAQIDQSASM
ncbi:hypothetical protein [Lewinella sp. IMCC34183]|uniref:hypothetical protein n=1 Tax=Lewinella sp. IMCC34183 TaxID=2248762 RepID=UPI000E281127|nr:hypothetical protein [Lewinella sp. IMCC34183]